MLFEMKLTPKEKWYKSGYEQGRFDERYELSKKISITDIIICKKCDLQLLNQWKYCSMCGIKQ